MAAKSKTPDSAIKNGQEDIGLEIDVDVLREQLGIVALEEENRHLRELLGQILTYINQVDLAVQELNGDAVVTETHRYNVSRGGKVNLNISRPSIPSNLADQGPGFGAVKSRD